MSATKDKKNCTREYTKKVSKAKNSYKRFAQTGKSKNYFDISVKAIDIYSRFDFTVGKLKLFCIQANRICCWVRRVLAGQEKWIPMRSLILISNVLIGIILFKHVLIRNKRRGKTEKSKDYFDISVKATDIYSRFDFAVGKLKLFCIQAIRICCWVRGVLAGQEKWIPLMSLILIILTMTGIIFIMRNLEKNLWRTLGNLYLYKIARYLWQRNVNLWGQVLMKICLYLPP